MTRGFFAGLAVGLAMSITASLILIYLFKAWTDYDEGARRDRGLPLTEAEIRNGIVLRELTLGEILIRRGDTENGVDHLIIALIVCEHNHSLSRMLERIIPNEALSLLVWRLRQYDIINDFGLNRLNWEDDGVADAA